MDLNGQFLSLTVLQICLRSENILSFSSSRAGIIINNFDLINRINGYSPPATIFCYHHKVNACLENTLYKSYLNIFRWCRAGRRLIERRRTAETEKCSWSIGRDAPLTQVLRAVRCGWQGPLWYEFSQRNRLLYWCHLWRNFERLVSYIMWMPFIWIL